MATRSNPTRRNLLVGAACVAVLPVPAIAATSTADVNTGAFCTKTGACPCADPCIWGRQAIDDLRRAGWPAVENSTAPDAELIEILGEAGRVA